MKKDADYVFYELTRSICPKCRKVIDAKVLLRDNKVYMRKRCPDCGPFEALVYSDAQAYSSNGRYKTSQARFRWPSTGNSAMDVPTIVDSARTISSTPALALSK
jgi:uncharacterized radical SAM superfamily Fe-S cluster-containing enzyme